VEPVAPGSRASSTAEFMALFRALESSRAPGRAVFVDPYAALFLRPSLRLVVLAARFPLARRLVEWWIDRRYPGARTSGIARTRLIDDAVVEALGGGIAQVVLLGAGFDARGLRLSGIDRARVFEVDHPATQPAKKAALESCAAGLVDRVAFVEMDFERDDLGHRLGESGFRRDLPAIFVWEGVTNYLTADAVAATMRAIAALAAPGSRLVFTYVHRGAIDGPASFGGMRSLSAMLATVGEPWKFGLYPAEVGGYLKSFGFSLSLDLGARDYRAKVLRDPGCGYEFYRVAMAARDLATGR
jgi:methyltransferase (TIGR00027 family)